MQINLDFLKNGFDFQPKLFSMLRDYNRQFEFLQSLG